MRIKVFIFKCQPHWIECALVPKQSWVSTGALPGLGKPPQRTGKVSAEYRAKSEMKVKEKNKVSGKKQAWRATQLKTVLLCRARFMSGVCMCRADCKRQHASLPQADKRCHGVCLTNCNSRTSFVIWKLRLVNVTVAIERIPVDVYEQDVLNTWQHSNMERSNSSFF